jgi:hypothetical protein
MTPRNCYGLFKGTYNGLPRVHFCEQASIWPKQIQIGHEEKKNYGTKQFPKVH